MDYALFYKEYAMKYMVYDDEKNENSERIIKEYSNYVALYESHFNYIIPKLLDSFLYLNLFNGKKN